MVGTHEFKINLVRSFILSYILKAVVSLFLDLTVVTTAGYTIILLTAL